MPGNDTDDLFFEFRNSASSTTGASASALDEVSALMAMPTIHTNTLHFQQESKLIRLKALASSILSVPATSAPVERVFSASGFIMRPRRSRLLKKHVTMLTFLKVNRTLQVHYLRFARNVTLVFCSLYSQRFGFLVLFVRLGQKQTVQVIHISVLFLFHKFYTFKLGDITEYSCT